MTIKDFTLKEPPLRGITSLVYEGVKEGGERRAFKCLHAANDEEAQTLRVQLQREVNLQAALHGPHFAQAFGAFQWRVKQMDGKGHAVDEEHYAVVEREWLKGMDLRQLMHRVGHRLSPTDVLQVAHQAAEALGEAHAVGIVHGNVKPSNLFLTLDGRIVLTDFGMGRVRERLSAERLGLADPANEALDFCGTMAYAPLEQMVGAKLGPTADVYSLGRTLECLAEDSPDWLNDIVERCTQPDPSRRYQQMDEVRTALSHAPLLGDGLDASLQVLGELRKEWEKDHPDTRLKDTSHVEKLADRTQKPEPQKPEPDEHAAPTMKICPNCGALCEAGDAFCMHCGHNLMEPAPETEASGSSWMCNDCHARWTDPSNEGNTNFCPMCGSKHFVRIG